MDTEKIGGRKFIGFIICMAGWGAVLYLSAIKGILTGDNVQSFLFFLIAIQGIFFGGNIAEKLIAGKLNGNGKGEDNNGK